MEESYPGCREIVRRAFSLKDLNEDTIRISQSSITDKTYKQYNAGLEGWWKFCSARKIDPYKKSVQDILNYLTEGFMKGSSYSVLNTTRSALSLIFDNTLAENPEIARFFRGVSHMRPPRPRYEETWDPAIVLRHLESIDNKSTTLCLLGKKLITLLALTTAHRLQTLSLIKIENMEISDTEIKIRITDRTKTTDHSKFYPLLVIPVFEENPSLCVAGALKEYLSCTSTLRKGSGELFLIHKRPHSAASVQTLSRWIKDILRDSGIDTDKFSGYSTRHASTSAADRSGVSLDTIRKTAGWTDKSSTFAKFYNRPVSTGLNFAKQILRLQ